jgi:guanylate kinase
VKRGRVVVISGPSGVGKSTLTKRLLEKKFENLARSISATTRKPRPGERDGVDYFFYSTARFRQAIEKGELIEHAEIFGNLYGVPRAPLERMLAEGRNVILEIDVQGARHVRELGLDAVFVFISPPGEEALVERLDRRGDAGPETRRIRLAKAREEMAQRDTYDVAIVNDTLDRALERLEEALARLGILKVHHGKRKA